MKRLLLVLAISVLAAIVACEDQSVAPATKGSIKVRLQSPTDVPSGSSAIERSGDQAARTDTDGAEHPPTGRLGTEASLPGSVDGRAPAEPAGHLQSIRVTVDGATKKNQTFQCTPSVCEGTVDGLDPGTYSVTVEGLVGSEVDYYGRTTGVSVQAGSSTTATISFQTFRPTLADFPAASTTAMRFTVTYAAVPNADSYISEWAKAIDFTGTVGSTTATTTSATITVQDVGTYYVRVRAVNATAPSGGRPSDAKSISVTLDENPSGDDAPTAPLLSTQWNFTGTLTKLNIFPQADQDWFKIQVCTNDVLTVETFAARLNPASTLNTLLRLRDASGTQIESNDDATGTTDSRIQKAVTADGLYYAQVTSANTSVGHYELSVNVQAGSKNVGTKCTTTKTVLISAPQDTLVALGDQMQLTATALDTTGSPVSGVTFAWGSSNPSVLGVDQTGLVTALANGDATITATESGTPGQKAIAVAQAVATVTVSPGTVTIAPGATQQFDAAAFDANGNPVTVTFFWASSDHNVAIVDQTGLATGVDGGNVTITAVGKGQPGSSTLTVTAQVATQLAFSIQPSNTTAGDAISPAIQVEIRDASNELVTAARDAVTIAIGANPGGGTLAGTKVVNAINGIASFSGLWINKSATAYTLAGTSGSLTGATSSTFNVAPGAPAKLAFSGQPTNVQGSVAINPAVTVTITDLFDNVTSATNQVTVSLGTNPWATPFSSGGTLSGAQSVAAFNGVATFNNLKIDKPAPGYALAGSAATLAGATSSGFNVNLTVRQVSAGGSHTCARVFGGTAPDSARAYCWGYNGQQQLGAATGSIRADSVPALVRQPAAGGPIVLVYVSAGGNHSCGLTATGAAYCWGYNYYGQLGNGATVPGAADQGLPVLVTGGHVFKSIAAGSIHTCGVTGPSMVAAEDRQVYCWGYNFYGQLGNGVALPPAAADQQASTPVRVVEPLQTVKADSVTAGNVHTCAWVQGGNGYCWGYDGSGQLGDDAPLANKSVPTSVAGGLSWNSISAGDSHTCGAIMGADNGRCWGYNGNGQVGNNTVTTPQPVPASVFGGLTFTSISAGGSHSCGLTSTFAGYCWGYNGNGQLGDDNAPTNSSARVLVAGGLTFTAIDVGSQHSCGRTSTALYCWGASFSGEVGDGARGSFRKVPVQIVQ